jgi:cytoskeleton protein RodZ
LKEIGEKLKEAREDMGISLEEVSEDLKMRPNQVEAVENGNMEAFKDIYSLKYFIKDYAKYLGLNYEDLVDDFNEYIFDYTSKISVEDIKNAKKEKVKEDKEQMHSPYTIDHSGEKKSKVFGFIIVILIILCVIGYFVYKATSTKTSTDSVETAVIE